MSDTDEIERLRRLYRRQAEQIGPPPPFGNSRQSAAPPKVRRWRLQAALATMVAVAVSVVLVARSEHGQRDDDPASPQRLGSGARWVTDDAMAPSILAGDVVEITTSTRMAKRFDLVIVGSGDSSTDSAEPARITIRRLVGLPGDRVQIRNGSVVVNGAAHPSGLTVTTVNSPAHVVAKGSYAVLPDNLADITTEGRWWAQRGPAPLRYTIKVTGTRVAQFISDTPPDLRVQPASDPTVRAVAREAGVPGPGSYIATDERNGFVQLELPYRQSLQASGWHKPLRGWVAVRTLTISTVPERVEVDIDAKRLHVTFVDGTTLTTLVAIGKPQTPTPRGRYQLLEIRRRTDLAVFGPGEIRTSARSDVFSTYGPDNPYLIAIQGTNDPATIGKVATNGNLRVRNNIWEQLAHLPSGTPVIIR